MIWPFTSVTVSGKSSRACSGKTPAQPQVASLKLGKWCTFSDLFGLESGWHPGVLLRGASRVVVWDGVPLEVGHQLGHHLLQLAGHGAHRMLFTHTLTVHTDLPVEEGRPQRRGFVRTWQHSVSLVHYRLLCGATKKKEGFVEVSRAIML